MKVSEVAEELEAMGCHRDKVTELFVACGILEEEEESKYKVGDIYEIGTLANGGAYKYVKLCSMTDPDGPLRGFEFDGNKKYNTHFYSEDWFTERVGVLIWREPK